MPAKDDNALWKEQGIMSSRARYLAIGVLAVVMFVVLAVILLRAVGFRPDVDAVIGIGESQAIVSSSDPSKPKLRVAVSAMISPRTTMESYAAFAEYLASGVGMESDLIVRKTYQEVNDLLEEGSVDVAFVCTGAYVLGDQKDKMELVASPIVRGEKYYYSYIIVPSDSTAESLSDLRGKRFAFVDELSNTGRNAPRRLLHKRGIDPDSFFSGTIITGSHDKSIRVVADHVVDGAAIDHLIYDAMKMLDDDYVARTRVVEKIGPFGMPPIVVPAGSDEELKARLLQVLLAAEDDPEAREYLRPLGIDGFRVPPEADYDISMYDVGIRSTIVRER
jgi:phosphonate transport system substrate-binding protein